MAVPNHDSKNTFPPDTFDDILEYLETPVLFFNDQYNILHYNPALKPFTHIFCETPKDSTNFIQKNQDIRKFLPNKEYGEQLDHICQELITLSKKGTFSEPNSFVRDFHVDYPIFESYPAVKWKIVLRISKTTPVYQFLAIISINSSQIDILHQLEQQYKQCRSLHTASPLGIGSATNRIITSVNTFLCRLLGYSESELVGQSARILYPSEEEYLRVGRIKHPKIAKHGVGSVETQFITKDRHLRDIFLSSAATKDRDIHTSIIFTALDITPQKNVARSLHDTQKMLHTVLESLPIRIFWKSLDSTYIGCNGAYAKDVGLRNPSDIQGKSDFDLFPEDLAIKYREDDVKVIQSGKGFPNIIEPQLNATGEYRWFRTTKVPLRNSEGEIVGILGSFNDITAIHEAETKVSQMEHQMTQFQKLEAVGRLAGGVAHEINNILSAIVGYADLLLLDYPKETDPIGEAASVISRNARRGSNLTKQLLGFARAGKYNPRPLNINTNISEVIGFLEKSFPKSIHIHSDLAFNPLIVNVDSDQFQLVISNLLINARDAMPEGGEISVSTSLVNSSSPEIIQLIESRKNDIKFPTCSQYARITIKDTGVGMPDSVRAHLFEPFFSTKGKQKGTGLGLPMVYGIILNHQGLIRVESQPQHGTQFFLYLPLSQESQAPAPIMESKILLSGTGKILLVDDEEDVRNSLQLQLRKMGYCVDCAQNGQEALELYRSNMHDYLLVILDLVMPVMDGFECYKHLVALNSDVKVVAISGFTEDEQVSQMITNGMKGFLQKPFNFHALTSVLTKVL